jgi:hypothetical protein
MARFAEGTRVPVERTQGEIIQLLTRYGAADYGYGRRGQVAAVVFAVHGVRVRFELKLPTEGDFVKTADGKRSIPAGRRAELVRTEERRLWRALLLVIKSKLESVDSGIEDFTEAFLGQVVVSDESTMADVYTEVLAPAIAAGRLPEKLAAIAG